MLNYQRVGSMTFGLAWSLSNAAFLENSSLSVRTYCSIGFCQGLFGFAKSSSWQAFKLSSWQAIDGSCTCCSCCSLKWTNRQKTVFFIEWRMQVMKGLINLSGISRAEFKILKSSRLNEILRTRLGGCETWEKGFTTLRSTHDDTLPHFLTSWPADTYFSLPLTENTVWSTLSIFIHSHTLVPSSLKWERGIVATSLFPTVTMQKNVLSTQSLLQQARGIITVVVW